MINRTVSRSYQHQTHGGKITQICVTFVPGFEGTSFLFFYLLIFLWICQRKSSRVGKYDYSSFKVYFWAYCIHSQCKCYSFIFSNTLSLHETLVPLSPIISNRNWNFPLSSLYLRTSWIVLVTSCLTTPLLITPYLSLLYHYFLKKDVGPYSHDPFLWAVTRRMV